MSSDFYATSIAPFAPIIIKICRAYANTQEDFEDYYQEVCLQIWRSHASFDQRAAWSTWIYRVALNVCMTLLKTQKRHRRLFAPAVVPPELIEDSRAFTDESLNRLYDAIRQLSEVDRAVILLYLSTHIVDRIQRMLKINQIAILVAAPIVWAQLSLVGLPYAGGIICTAWMGLVVVQWFYIAKFEPPATGLDSYHYVKAFHGWLKRRMVRSRRLQRHLYAVTFAALAIGMGASEGGQKLIRSIVNNNPGLYLINGVPWFLIAALAGMAVVVELFGGVIFDFDVNAGYRHVFRKLDEMVAEMEELRAEPR